MNVTSTPELQKRVREKSASGDYKNADALVQQAPDWFLDIEKEDELEETKAAIKEARSESSRGEAVPADEVFDQLWAKYGIPR